jgi:hypothetical protein
MDHLSTNTSQLHHVTRNMQDTIYNKHPVSKKNSINMDTWKKADDNKQKIM